MLRWTPSAGSERPTLYDAPHSLRHRSVSLIRPMPIQTLELGAHPYGVQPSGNEIMDRSGGACRRDRLGLLSALTDEQLIDQVLAHVDHTTLCTLAMV